MTPKFRVSSLTHKTLNQILTQLIINPKPHNLNPLLGSLINSTIPENALFMYNQMLYYPTSHNHYTFTYALKACALLKAHQKGLEIHARVLKCGHFYDVFIQNSLLHFYIHKNDIVSASKIFCSIRFPNVVSWTLIISGLCKCGFEEEAIVKFLSMDVEPNSFTLVSVMSACSSLRALKLGKAVHGYSLRNLSEHNIILDNAILDFYTSCGCLVNANNLFDKMPKRDVFSWTTLIGGYAQTGLCDEAATLFQQMVEGDEAKPNQVTIVNLLSACSSVGALNLGEWIHTYINGQPDLVISGNVGNALINMYVKCSHLGMAFQVFNTLKSKDTISWSTMISGMAMNGHGNQVLQLFSLMIVHGVPPDGVTFVSLLSACSHVGLVDKGLMFFNAMKNVYGIEPRVQHYACVVDMYGRAGLLEAAEDFIRGMPIEADAAVWGALLNACRIHGNDEMFERIKGCLVDDGVNIGTLALLSNAYASSHRWDDAHKVRDEMRWLGEKKMAGCSWIEVNHNQQP
ncbi:pentatricopeptide repeat-containing protein At2g29760, chloroplastic-like [Humulus lupulus]|uniref:pentatricopeptide repeat-containing protein At2g29760, chloroplastic-like n=1 Tax=Humulus lupulus TaxID=3486 RepID=UPI002B409140|nr:pentatricopeptide repeat-containing protein At2g29760, chloroplastic-like [Humulus lupulus]